MPSAQRQRAERRGPEARRAQQVGLDQRLRHPALDDAEADGGERRPARRARRSGRRRRCGPGSAPRRAASSRRPAGRDRARRSGAARRPTTRRSGAGWARAGPARATPDHGVRLAPAGPEVERGREDRAGGDAETDAGAPDRGGVHAGRAGREVVGEHGEPAGQHRRSPDALDAPGPRRRARLLGDRARPARRGRSRRGRRRTPGAGRRRRRARPAASSAAARPTDIELRIQARATGPAPRSAAVARDRRHRRHVGDQHEGGPERDRQRATWSSTVGLTSKLTRGTLHP